MSVAGSRIEASAAEFRLIELLLSYRDVPLPKEAILDALFEPGHGRDPRQVDVFVARLRRRFNAAGIGDVIGTIAGRGYALLQEGGERHAVDNVRPDRGEVLLAA